MDHREFETTIKHLQKTVALNEAASNVLAILERLKKEAMPTEDMLRVSQCPILPSVFSPPGYSVSPVRWLT